jgi:hypothetical protein
MGFFLLWQTAVHLRAVCQGVIPFVQTLELDRGLPHKAEIQYQPFYIDSLPVRAAVSFIFMRDFTSICKTYM